MSQLDYEQFPVESLEIAMNLIEELGFSDKEMASMEEDITTILNEDNYTTLDLTYYGEPKAQARARTSGLTGFFYDPSQSLKAWLVEQITSQLPRGFTLVDTEIHMECKFYKGMPKSASKKAKVMMELGVIRPTTKPDNDNYLKLVQDALNRVLYTDDAVITKVSAEKYFSCKPRARIKLRFKRK